MWKRILGGKEKGSAMEFMSFGLVLLGFATIMMVYLGCVELVEYKLKTGQIARKYILRMESVGYLNTEDRISLVDELEELGLTQVDLYGTTMEFVGYGEEIILSIRGKVSGKFGAGRQGLYEIKELRVSTAKN